MFYCGKFHTKNTQISAQSFKAFAIDFLAWIDVFVDGVFILRGEGFENFGLVLWRGIRNCDNLFDSSGI